MKLEMGLEFAHSISSHILLMWRSNGLSWGGAGGGRKDESSMFQSWGEPLFKQLQGHMVWAFTSPCRKH